MSRCCFRVVGGIVSRNSELVFVVHRVNVGDANLKVLGVQVRQSCGRAHFTSRAVWLKHRSNLRPTRFESRHVHLLPSQRPCNFSSMASKQTQKTQQQQQQQQQQSQAQLAKQKAAEEAEKIKEYIARQVLLSSIACTSQFFAHFFQNNRNALIVSIILIVIPMTSMNTVTSSYQSPCSK